MINTLTEQVSSVSGLEIDTIKRLQEEKQNECLTFTLLNVNGLTSKFKNLKTIFNDTEPHLGIITETRRNPKKNPKNEKLNGYKQFHNIKSAKKNITKATVYGSVCMYLGENRTSNIYR